jgi:hypothetical protein
MNNRLLCCVGPVILLGVAGCTPSFNPLQVTVEAYISAVSLSDTARMMDLTASYQRELPGAADDAAVEELQKRYRGIYETAFMAWEAGRGTGKLEFDQLGIALIRGIGLGKEGAAAIPLGVRFEADNTRGIVMTRAITNYEAIRWDYIPTSGRMYLMGVPFGTVVNFAPAVDDVSELELLATVDVEWTLVRVPDASGSPAGWYVERVTALPETATAWSPGRVTR